MIPLNVDALAALARLLERARALGQQRTPSTAFFPACEEGIIDPSRTQKSWRTRGANWFAKPPGASAGEAAQQELSSSSGLRGAIAAWKRAAAPIHGIRFHDLRHQAITEMAEAGASDATLMAVAGHMSRRMLEHCSHVRMAAKRTALEKLESGLMGGPSATSRPESRKAN